MSDFPDFVIARSRRLRGNPAKAGAVLDCFAAAQRQFILSGAAGGVEGLAMTELEQLARYEDRVLTDA